MKEFLVGFGLGIVEGLILCDWMRARQINKVGAANPAHKKR